MKRFAINGFGRIGRNILRAWIMRLEEFSNWECAFINCGNFGDLKSNLHLLQYDSVHGGISGISYIDENTFVFQGKLIKSLFINDIDAIKWDNIDVVLECTGVFTSYELAFAHITSGAKKALVSAPCKDADATIVYGVNDCILKKEDVIISAGSCTTNCLAIIAKVMHENFVINNGFMTTVHAYTNDQSLLDSMHKDLRRARSAQSSIIPASTGAAKTIGLVIPELDRKLDGCAVRVPVPNVSFLDLMLNIEKKATVEDINEIFYNLSQDKMKNILSYNDQPLVSIDFNGNLSSAIFDSTQTKSFGNTCKLSAWYDNEFAFANRMLDMLKVLKF